MEFPTAEQIKNPIDLIDNKIKMIREKISKEKVDLTNEDVISKLWSTLDEVVQVNHALIKELRETKTDLEKIKVDNLNYLYSQDALKRKSKEFRNKIAVASIVGFFLLVGMILGLFFSLTR